MTHKNIFLQYYDNYILNRPKLIFTILIILFCFLAFKIKDFKLDASTHSLILEHDSDLQYSQKINYRYEDKQYLIITYSPYTDLFSKKSLNVLKNIKEDLNNLKRTSSIVTILDVPLFKSPPIPLKEIKNTIITLESEKVDKISAREEILKSPLYNNLLISRDGKSSAIQINFKDVSRFDEVKQKRSKLLLNKHNKIINAKEIDELKKLNFEYKLLSDRSKLAWKNDIKAIRKILKKYKKDAKMHLGGLPMISNDMIEYVKKDLKLFGTGIFIFIFLTLGIIFKKFQWIIITMLGCFFSVISMIGILGIFGWEVTVISSNFISLQLIFTMALNIHLVVKFNEVIYQNPKATNKELIKKTIHAIFTPCLFTVLTTIAGFVSLVISNILPVVNFGWMMSAGLCVSFIITFLFFPSCYLLFHEEHYDVKAPSNFKITNFFANYTEKHGKKIIIYSLIVSLITIFGIFNIRVENSFIDYFKKSTEIYKSLKFIDQNLGGTTTLDVIIDFPETKNNTFKNSSDMDLNFDEFENDKDDKNKYWFTEEKVLLIQNIHDFLDNKVEVGKVISLNTMMQIIKSLTTAELNNFDLAILFNELPKNLKSIAVDPFISIEHNQARISLRIIDTFKNLNRNKFLMNLNKELKNKFESKNNKIKITGLMLLYNNMLQSLFSSQIKTIGFTLLSLYIMFVILFKSFKIAFIAILPNALSCLVILGVMGIFNIPLDLMTITIVAISIGIAVDNTIHYIHRFEKEILIDNNYINTMKRCHDSIGKAMYYTSITIIIGFSILSFSNFIPLVIFGLLTSLSMLIALVASLTLLPKLILIFKPFIK